jgi:hypothetical protein
VGDAPGEGLYSYIQTTICRRTILTRIFGNATPGKHSSKFFILILTSIINSHEV